MEGILGWVKGIICWLLIMSLMLQCVPGKVYRSYLRLFMGIILILTVLAPLSNWDGTTDGLESILEKLAYEEAVPGWKDSPVSGDEWEERLLRGGEWAENYIVSVAEKMSEEEMSEEAEQWEDMMDGAVDGTEAKEVPIEVSGGE